MTTWTRTIHTVNDGERPTKFEVAGSHLGKHGLHRELRCGGLGIRKEREIEECSPEQERITPHRVGDSVLVLRGRGGAEGQEAAVATASTAGKKRK